MQRINLSFEFFPPKTAAGNEKLMQTVTNLTAFKPNFFSVTFGAGGSTRNTTKETVCALQELSSVNIVPHISCIGSSKNQIRELLQAYQNRGFDQLVVLRGDLPSGMGSNVSELRYANELVEFIRQETGDHFYINVAAYPEIHPQAKTATHDLSNFVRKINAGANCAITQYFYNAEAYFQFVEECDKHGITIPIVPGIMPIHNFAKLQRFSQMCGADIPLWLQKRLHNYGDDTVAIREFGIEVVTRLCQTLINNGVPGIHFYTLNQFEPTQTIVKNLH